MRQVGVGGPAAPGTADMGYAIDEVNRTAVEIKTDLEKYERAISLEKSSMEEIETRIRENMDRVDHFPSIRPVLGGMVRDGYGYRIDPFTKKLAHHDGIDVPMPEGTKVLASADGIVVEAKTGYIPHKSYGIEVIVDHGFGYKSRYAHLHKILVYKGQKVKKWDPIGEVGETGRASGSHLHYEVMFEGKTVDPENYIYN
jgi:murein DD-endopeptidase MepM/ murein hydrolase activator NlpD